MSMTFATDGSNDLFVGTDGRLSVVSGLDAIRYACEHIAKSQLGEMIYATDRGLPNFELVWSGAPNLPQWEASLRAALLSVDGVLDVPSLSVTRSAGVLSYTAEIKTAYGGAVLNG